MANAFLDDLIDQHLIFNTDLSRKITTLSREFADAETHDFNEIVKKLSPPEQRFWCLVRMKQIMKEYLIKEPEKLYRDITAKLKKTEDPKKSVSDEEFDTIVETFSTAIADFLQRNANINVDDNPDLFNAKQNLLAELQIQEAEFTAANRQTKKALVIKGLICLALSTASVVLVTVQGTMCAVLSIPMGLLGASYAVLAYEVEPLVALAKAMRWVKHLYEDKQMHGMAAIFVFGAGYYQAIKADLLMEELFKAAQDILPAVPKPILGMAVAAIVPPLYFLNQFNKFRKNSNMMSELFKHEDIVKHRLKA
jgi:hypothetical protein